MYYPVLGAQNLKYVIDKKKQFSLQAIQFKHKPLFTTLKVWTNDDI